MQLSLAFNPVLLYVMCLAERQCIEIVLSNLSDNPEKRKNKISLYSGAKLQTQAFFLLLVTYVHLKRLPQPEFEIASSPVFEDSSAEGTTRFRCIVSSANRVCCRQHISV